MCGRYTLKPDIAGALLKFLPTDLTYDLEFLTQFGATYNAAPSQTLPVILPEDDRLVAQGMSWGLVPSWAKEKKFAPINAKSETVASNGMFRNALKARRCIVPASGFYEWRGPKGAKQPYLIQPTEGEIFLFAGLWEEPGPASDDQTYTIITTEANDKMSYLHDRMPVMLQPDDLDLWLDSDIKESGPLETLFAPPPDDYIDYYPVSKAVNKVGNNEPSNIEPLEEDED